MHNGKWNMPQLGFINVKYELKCTVTDENVPMLGYAYVKI